jgi:hypothetical protein
MKVRKVVVLYRAALVVLLAGWFINLLDALHHPKVDWRDAAGLPALVLVFSILALLTQARRRLLANPSASLEISASRYVLAGCAASLCVLAVVAGYYHGRG